MILIVDDNRQIRQMIRSLIEDLDSEFCECADGCEALASFEQNRPDWVLMDLAMRKVNGLTATRQIMSSYPQARIIIVTSYDNAAMRETVRIAGAAGYVLKENLSDLRGIISNQIG